MADGPRCKRRKQANPRRNNVTNYNNGLEACSDTDDEDKLHIVEEAEGAECDSTLPDEEHPREHCWDRVKEEPLSELEDERSTDALVEEMLQQGDTAVIYPEAPEDELPRLGTPDDELSRLGTPEAGVADENGTPDSFSQLLTCPFCSRGYKRYSSLKEHIKYRHEKSEDSFNCPECSYSFSHRAQLERHMTAHRTGRDQRHIPQSAGNRKFKCTECGKAFKYKHHLKEHLRIHSGEKPYECSNCKKRFSHSGSYSSHISSKKCISVVSSLSSRPRVTNPKSQAPTAAALPSQIRDKLEPLQEQLPVNQIKSEPLDYEYKAAVMGPPAGVFTGGAAAPPLQGTVQAVVLPTVGLVSPISINIADLQNALKVAVDGNVIRQVLESKGQGLTAGTFHAPLPAQQQLISAISLPIVGQDGNAKIIINYSLDASQAQVAPQNLKKEPILLSEKLPEDLTLKFKGPKDEVKEEKEETEEGKTTNTCLLCEHCPVGLEALHALKHGKRLNGVDKSESTITSLLSEGGLCTQPKNLLSLLKDYYALNAEPTKDDLAVICDSVSLPEHVVRKWFDKMKQQGALGAPTPPSEEEDSVVSLVPGKDATAMSPSVSQDSPTEATPAEVSSHSSPASPSPLNLTSTADAPLDLSLPKSSSPAKPHSPAAAAKVTDEPLNLTCMKKEPLSGVYASQSSAAPVVMPALVAITEQGRGVQCLRALGSGGKRTILIPQLAYSYSPAATSPAGTETHEAAIQLNGIKEERPDSEGLSAADEQDSDYGPARKKMKKTESGMYACDLCDKIFQKSSSLLRHKYEHTGKRPHECGICAKAFKHKHHLIEHMRLHSGEKPYQCDKCGKRFSHSGSYSQHMNHRYSYCKREPGQAGVGGGGPLASDGGNRSPADEPEDTARVHPLLHAPSHTDSDERGSEEDEDEEGAVDMEDIRVVQVEDDGTEEDEAAEDDTRQAEEEEAEEEARDGTKDDSETAADVDRGDPSKD